MVAIIYAACFCELIYVFTCKYLAPFVVLKSVFLFALKVVESSYDGLITWFLALKPCDSNISVHPSWSYPAWVQMVGPSAATKKKQVYALAGFLVLCDLRSTELWIPSKEASITDRLFYQSQWCFLELKQLSSEQIMEPSKPRISSHRNQNWTEDYEQGWTGSGRLIIWIVSRIITILVWMEQEQALLHRKQSGMLWVLMCLGVCKWKLIMKSSYHS